MKFFAVVFLAAIFAYVSADESTADRPIVVENGEGRLLEYDPTAVPSGTQGAAAIFSFDPCRIKDLGNAICLAKCIIDGSSGGLCADKKCLCLVPGIEPETPFDPSTGSVPRLG